MSLYRTIQQIKAQIIDTTALLELVLDHPLMAEGLKEKIKILETELKKLPNEVLEPKIQLLFSGNAVKGSEGIKSSFFSKTVTPFQAMIKTQTALVRSGTVGLRGGAKNGDRAELFITALPLGSFGIELSQLNANDLFEAQEVANAMRGVIHLINDSSLNDNAFEASIENTPKRNLSNLKKFLKEVADEKSMIKMETGEMSIEIPEIKVIEAYTRVAATTNEEEELFTYGILRGILLDSSKFEIHDSNGIKISGIINEELNEEELIQINKLFLNKNCTIHLKKHSTSFKTGNKKITYELINIDDSTHPLLSSSPSSVLLPPL